MKEVTIHSIQRATPQTHVILEVEVEGMRHRCEMRELPGETGLGFDDAFDRLFTRTLFARAIGRVVSQVLRGEPVAFPVRMTEERIAAGLASR